MPANSNIVKPQNDKIFEPIYGANLDLNKLIKVKKGVPYVGRSMKNNGITAYVERVDTPPNPAHTISVSGGGSVLECFYQSEEFYSGRDLFFLKPKTNLNEKQMLAYCYLIKLNKYKTVEVRQKLLGEKPGVESFYHASDKDSGTSYALKEIDDQSLNWEKVKTSTLDKELKHEKSIKVLKMDVEGFEGNVLRGSKNLLEKDLIRYWIIEYTQHCLARNNDSLDTLRTLMEKHNLEMFILDPSGGLPKFIPNKVAIKAYTIPNLLFTKTKHLNEDWVMEDIENHIKPKSLWPM